MGHSYNHGMVTSGKGMAFEACKITVMNTANCTIDEQASSGFVESAAIASGLVTVQLAGPYPPRLVACIPAYSGASTTADIVTARYVDNSYDATNGTLQIALSNDDDSGAPAAGSPGATDELHLLMVFCRYTVL